MQDGILQVLASQLGYQDDQNAYQTYMHCHASP